MGGLSQRQKRRRRELDHLTCTFLHGSFQASETTKENGHYASGNRGSSPTEGAAPPSPESIPEKLPDWWETKLIGTREQKLAMIWENLRRAQLHQRSRTPPAEEI